MDLPQLSAGPAGRFDESSEESQHGRGTGGGRGRGGERRGDIVTIN